MALLLLFVGFALGVSFLCSTLEAALLSVRMATLVDQSKRGKRGSGLLLGLKRARIDDAISAILVLNTIANTLGATLAGAQAARVFGSQWVGVFSGVLTFLILILSEIVPKTLGTVYAPGLANVVGYVLHALTRVMAPALVLSRALTRLLTRGTPQMLSRGELEAIIDTATREGAISREESTMFGNLLRVRSVRLEDVMTPRTVAFAMPSEATVEQLLDKPGSAVFSRIPLYGEHEDDVNGYVLIRDVLRDVAKGGERTKPLSAFARKIQFLPEMISVETGLKHMLAGREPLAMVTDEHGGIAGLVTLEDLTETLLGVEIVDESDRIVDMRQAAAELRDRRLRRMLEKRERLSDRAGSAGEEGRTGRS